MNYPVKEHEQQVIAKKREDMETLAKFYVESDTIDEFKVRAAAAGIHSRYMLMSFYIYYAAMNSTFHRDDEIFMMITTTTFLMVVVLLALTASLLFLFGGSFWWLLLYLPFTVAIAATVKHVFWGCVNYAERYISSLSHNKYN